MGGDRRALAALGILAALLLSGCGLVTLRENLARAGQLATIEGDVRSVRGGSGPIVVVAYSVERGQVVDHFVLPRSGPFFFVLPAGTYHIGAFEDRSQDASYQPREEPAVLFDEPEEIALGPGQKRAGIELVIDPAAHRSLPFSVSAAEQRQAEQLPAPHLGEIVGLDDPRFSEESATLGLWDPLRFLFEVGAGVYFLEDYDPEKIPVLFVHGAMGHPANWSALVPTLDRDRFQPWLFFYPTAPRLEAVSRFLVRTLGALQAKYGFSRLVLVAHSMGGLVTRGAINYAIQNQGSGRVVDVPAFVSIASPWNGHPQAAKGVERSPVVAPYWIDMAPDSDFLKALPQTPLPAECHHTLFFAYGGEGGRANDGSVSVASQLSLPIELQADRVLGFDQTHRGILGDPVVAAELNAILAGIGP